MSLKLAVIIYHKNVDKIYKKEWIDEAIDSIRKQTFQEFDVIELNYGGKDIMTAYGEKLGRNYECHHKHLENHIFAMNYLIDYAFKNGYDVIANINLDDINHPQRFEKQLEAIKQGYQLVSSNFNYFDERGIFKQMNMVKCGDINFNLMRNHNVICHPAVMMHKSFWSEGMRYNNLLGFEDLDLWKRAIQAGKRFKILPDYLLNYRIHKNQVTQTHKLK